MTEIVIFVFLAGFVSIKLMSKRAFTLIEVLTVIAIIGILASITGYVYNSAMKRSRDTTRKTDLDTIKNALEQYYLDNRLYVPLTISGANQAPLATKYQLERYYTANSKIGGLVPHYISTLPTDPRYKSGSTTNDAKDYTYFPKVEDAAHVGKVTSYFLGAYVETKSGWSTTAPVYSDGSNAVANQIGAYTYNVASSNGMNFCYRWDHENGGLYPSGFSNGVIPREFNEDDIDCTSTYYLKGGR